MVKVEKFLHIQEKVEEIAESGKEMSIKKKKNIGKAIILHSDRKQTDRQDRQTDR